MVKELVSTRVESKRRRRPDGQISRDRILDAATSVAAERGYDGTTIAAVSKACGLPASSIYWHFTNKDDLIAAVIERSFVQWLQVWQLPDALSARDLLVEVAARTATAVKASPDFLRLGLMLGLERRPMEPRARATFVRVRGEAFAALAGSFRQLIPELSDEQIAQLATYAIAGADGIFIAGEIGGDDVDLAALFDIHGRALFDTAVRMVAENRPDGRRG